MSAKIIVSYDGTANEDDAIALGRIFARAGAEVSLAYVRHSVEPDYSGETLAQNEAEALLQRGAALLGNPDGRQATSSPTAPPPRACGRSPSPRAPTSSCSARTRTPPRATSRSATRPSACSRAARPPIAIAPAGLAEAGAEAAVQRIVAVGDANGGAQATAQALASALGATVAPVANQDADLLVIDSRPEAAAGSGLDQLIGMRT